MMNETYDVNDLFKVKLFELLYSVINAEMENNIEKYIIGVKHLIRLSWKYLSEKDKEYINKQIEQMNKEIEEAKKDVNSLRNKVIDIKYNYYDNLFKVVVSALLESYLLEEEQYAVITFEDENDIYHVHELIKNKKAFKKILEESIKDDTITV